MRNQVLRLVRRELAVLAPLTMVACSEADVPASASVEVEVSPQTVLAAEFSELPATAGIGLPHRSFAIGTSDSPEAAMSDSSSLSLTDDKSGELPTPAELRSAYQICQTTQNRPTTLAQLTGGYELYQSAYRENTAVALGIIGAGNVTSNKNAFVFAYHFWRIQSGNCDLNGHAIPVTWGVGIESTIHLRSTNRGAKTSSLPGLAASVELGAASVTMKMNVNGLVGAEIERAFPSVQTFQDFDVSAYGSWAVAMDKIRTLISDPTVTATPQLLFSEDALPAVAQALRAP